MLPSRLARIRLTLATTSARSSWADTDAVLMVRKKAQHGNHDDCNHCGKLTGDSKLRVSSTEAEVSQSLPLSPNSRFSPKRDHGPIRAPAAAGERAVVMRLAVVAGQLLAGLDATQGVELDVPLVKPHERVRLARMVDVTEVGSFARGVERRAVAELDDGDAVGLTRAPACLGQRDALAAELAHLPARGDGCQGEEPATLYATAPDFEAEGVQAREL